MVPQATEGLTQSFSQRLEQNHCHLWVLVNGLAQLGARHDARVNLIHGNRRRRIWPAVDERRKAEDVARREHVEQNRGAIGQHANGLHPTLHQQHHPARDLAFGPQNLTGLVVAGMKIGFQDLHGLRFTPQPRLVVSSQDVALWKCQSE